MTSINYYEILQLNKKASSDQIKQSYKKLALKHHPDKNQDKEKSKVMFTQISQAYSVLINPEKRAFYDQYGTTDMSSMDFGSQTFDVFFGSSFDEFESFLDDFMFTSLNTDFNKIFKEFGKASKGSKRNKRTKGAIGGKSGMNELNKLFGQMMGGFDLDSQMFQMQQALNKKSKSKSKKQEQDDQWQTDSEDQQNGQWQDASNSDSDDIPDQAQLMMLPIFIEQQSITTIKNKKQTMKCKIDSQTFKSNEALVDHFCQNHLKQFREWAKKR